MIELVRGITGLHTALAGTRCALVKLEKGPEDGPNAVEGSAIERVTGLTELHTALVGTRCAFHWNGLE